MKAPIDRFEGEWAVLQVDGREERRARKKLERGAREGDVIDLTTGRVDRAATDELREQVRAARERAAAKNPHSGGSFDL